MDNGGEKPCFLIYSSYDICDFDLRKFPRREALLDQIIQTMPSVKKFWFEQLRHGGIISISDRLKDYNSTEWPDAYSCANLYELYLDFAKAIGERYMPVDTQFGKQLRVVCPKITRKKKYGEWHYFLPTLAQRRDYFESLVKINIDWGNGR